MAKSKNKKMTMDFIRWGALSPQKHEEAKLPYNSEKRGYPDFDNEAPYPKSGSIRDLIAFC